MPPMTPPTMAPVLLELEDVDATGAVVAPESLSEVPVEGLLDTSVLKVGLVVDCDGESVVDCAVVDGDPVTCAGEPVV